MKKVIIAVVLTIAAMCWYIKQFTATDDCEQKVIVDYVIYTPTKEISRTTTFKTNGHRFERYYTSYKGTNDVYVINVDAKWYKKSMFSIYTGTEHCEIISIKVVDLK